MHVVPDSIRPVTEKLIVRLAAFALFAGLVLAANGEKDNDKDGENWNDIHQSW